MLQVIVVILPVFSGRGWGHDIAIPFFPYSQGVGFNPGKIFDVPDIETVHAEAD